MREERTHLFVISIWWEEREIPGLPPVWRGSIQYELTRQRLYFHDLAMLNQFLCQTAGLPPPRPSLKECLKAAFRRKR